MKFYLILLLLTSIYGSTCPNNCSGHGTCSKSICLCYEGYTFGDCSGKTCPFGKTYVEPGANNGGGNNDVHTDLECSGKGNCNRNNGLCECYEGYEGSACQRTSCPNNCNSHGVCVPVTHLNLNNNQYSNVYDKSGNGAYNKWDKDQSYACVCDGEYEGYDCSEKKCPVGYSATSDCEESSSESTITVKIRDPTNIGTYVYLEYTDMYGRKWYSDKFNPTVTTGDYGWDYALKRLPVGVIDYKGVTPSTTPINDGGTVTIHFGNQQSGRQGNIKIITYKDIKDGTAGKLYPGANTPSGYHGMSIEDLKVGYAATNPSYTSVVASGSNFEVTSSGVPASVCSGNGSCMTDTGLCECFDGFYGNACSLTESSM